MELSAKYSPVVKPIVSAVVLLLLLAASLCFLGYATPRNDFFQIISLYAAAFGCYALLWKFSFFNAISQVPNWCFWLISALFLRLLLLGMQPNLSDDFFRYIWDGRLLINHYNPFESKPEEWLDTPLYVQMQLGELYDGNPDTDWFYYQGLNSKTFYSVYPTSNQVVFAFAAWLFPKSVWGTILVMRLCLILAEMGTLLFSLGILRRLKLSENLIWLYAFNPLIIMELSGNLHCETLSVFFLSAAIWALLIQNKYSILFSSFFFSLAITAKLLPILFLPLFFSYLGYKKGFLFSGLTGLFTFLLLLPFLWNFSLWMKLAASVQLYFSYFEFNASFYYLAKHLCGFFSNDPPKQLLSLALNLGVLLYTLYLAFRWPAKDVRQLIGLMLLAFTAYCLATRTVHPWYITPLLWFCVFTDYRYPILWSALICLSYYAYSSVDYRENTGLLWVEYGLLGLWILWERCRCRLKW